MRQPPDPHSETTPTWPERARRRARFYLAASFLLALLAGILTFHYLDQIREKALPTGTALVARDDILPGTELEQALLEEKQVPLAILPGGYLRAREQAAGRSTLYPIAANEVIRRGDLVEEGGGLSSRLPDGRWAMRLPQGWFVSPLPPSVLGDRLDVIAYQEGHTVESANMIVSEIELLSESDPEGDGSLLIGVSLQEAQVILYAWANGFHLLGLLRPRGS